MVSTVANSKNYRKITDSDYKVTDRYYIYHKYILGKMHAVPSSLKGKYVIRFTVTSQRTTLEDISRDWHLIRDTATLLAGGEVVPQKTRVPLSRNYLIIIALLIFCIL